MAVSYKESISGRINLDGILLEEFNRIAIEVGGTNIILSALREYLSFSYLMRMNEKLSHEQQKVEFVKPRSYKAIVNGAQCAYRLNLSSILIKEYNYILKKMGTPQKIMMKALEEYLSLSFKSERDIKKEIVQLMNKSLHIGTNQLKYSEKPNDNDEMALTIDTIQQVQIEEKKDEIFTVEIKDEKTIKKENPTKKNDNKNGENEDEKVKAFHYDIRNTLPGIDDDLFSSDEKVSTQEKVPIEIEEKQPLDHKPMDKKNDREAKEDNNLSDKLMIDMSPFWE